MVYVTHDPVEAMTMADKIVVLNRGNIEQVGSPLELYKNPRNLFVAGFIGSPRMNLITGDYAHSKGAKTAGIRPEHLGLSKDSGTWAGTVKVAEHLGADTFLHLDVDGIGPVTARVDGEFGAYHGDKVFLTPDESKLHRFDERGLGIRS
jgi:multiple sugar transport system ATP-binding protein